MSLISFFKAFNRQLETAMSREKVGLALVEVTLQLFLEALIDN